MLPERMKKGEYVFSKSKNQARKILRVKKHPEYDDERIYILEGNYGIQLPPYETTELQEYGFDECLTREELNEKIEQGEYRPDSVVYVFGKKLKRGKGNTKA